MEFRDLVDKQRGDIALICTKDTPDDACKGIPCVKIGTHGAPLEYKVNTEVGKVQLGYREEERQGNEVGEIVIVQHHLEERIYLHSEGQGLVHGRVHPTEPLLSIAHQLGCVEIYTPMTKGMDMDFVDLLRKEGIKVHFIGKAAVAKKNKDEGVVQVKKEKKSLFGRARKKGKK